jgi:type IV pilus biogenesis protein CpaD/CtpE
MMTARHIAMLIVAALTLGACAGPTLNPPSTPTAAADTVQVDGFMRLSATGNPLGLNGSRDVQAFAARRGRVGVAQGLITAPRPGAQVDSVSQALQMQGVKPVVMIEPEADALELTLFRTVPAGCPDWANARITTALDTVTRHRNPYPADGLGLGCSLNTALDAMVANPRDLTDPPERMSPAHAAALGLTAERYRTTGPRPLPDRSAVTTAF